MKNFELYRNRIKLLFFIVFFIFVFNGQINIVEAGEFDEEVEVEDKTSNDKIKQAISDNVAWLPTASAGDRTFENGKCGDEFLKYFTWTDVRKNEF